LLAIFAVAAVLATTINSGADTIPLLLPNIFVLALLLRLRAKGKIRQVAVIAAIYASVWFMTAFISPICIKRGLSIEKDSTDVSFGLPADAFPQPPWHYCRVRSTPCPLVTVVDHGVLNEKKHGRGGRTWYLWIGNQSVPVRRASHWVQ
jgi:hypothetical protein